MTLFDKFTRRSPNVGPAVGSAAAAVIISSTTRRPAAKRADAIGTAATGSSCPRRTAGSAGPSSALPARMRSQG